MNFRCGGTGHKARDCTSTLHNGNQLKTTGATTRSDASSNASTHQIFTTYGEEDDESYIRYEIEGLTFGNDTPRPIRSTWAPPRPPTPRWPLQQQGYAVEDDREDEYTHFTMEGYAGDAETQTEEMSVVSSITDYFMQMNDDEYKVPRAHHDTSL